MSMGLEAVYKLVSVKNDKATYDYSGDNFSFPFDKELARSYDGRIEIQLSAVEMITTTDFYELTNSLFENDKARIVKECHYAERNSNGRDVFALRTVNHILRKYRETCELPKEGHWIV